MTTLKLRAAAPKSAALMLALALGACNTLDPADATGTVDKGPSDYRQRHPIVLAETPRSIDVFVGGSFNGLDGRQRDDVIAFAGEFLHQGKGGIVILVPEGVRFQHNVGPTLRAVRHELAASRVPAGVISVKTYRPQDPSIASPIRITFDRLQAKVASQCGQWPDDLGGIQKPKIGWENESYWNLGCAYQANFAHQIADPVDLVRGRQESPVDTVQRMNRIGKTRNSEDPTTIYKKDATKIDQSLGN